MSRQLTEQEQIRRDARQELEEFGVNPYPYEWEVDAHAADILDTYEDEKHDPEQEGTEPIRVSVAGRIMSRRVMGKASFFDLQDSTGTVQVYIRRDDIAEGRDFYNKVFKKMLDIGDIVGITGEVFRTRMGEVTVKADGLKVLSKALRPLPVVKEKEGEVYNEVTDKEFRYRQRYVDLTVNPEVKDVFKKRTQIIRTIQRFLDDRGYLEVETPVLQPIYGGAAARPFITHHNALDMPLYLRIADELYLKRLIVGGFDGVYEIGKDFRNEGLSRFHNPEFTMLELYVAYKDYEWMMELTEELIAYTAESVLGTTTVPVGNKEISFDTPWRRLRFFEALEEATGQNLQGADQKTLLSVADAHEVEVDPSLGVGKLYDELFGELVEPNLIEPTFVVDYPIELSPLAKRHREEGEEGIVERFEVIINGREICNAFSELNDPQDQRERFEEQVRLKEEGDEEAMHEVDEDYLRALEYAMPPTAGLGVGIDRLVMLLTNQESIRDVILFPLMRPEQSSTDTPEDGQVVEAEADG